MGEEGVDDRAEPNEGPIVFMGDWLVGEVPTGQHQRPPDRVHQQVMERTVGKKDAPLGQARSDRGRQPCTRAPRRQHDGSAGRKEGRLGSAVEPAQGAGCREVGHHDREGLVVPGLPTPQLLNGHGVRRVRSQVGASASLREGVVSTAKVGDIACDSCST